MPAYVIGDATQPRGLGPKVLCHCVNDVGMWGAGFVLALAKWPWVEKAYREWARTGKSSLEVRLPPRDTGEPLTSFGLGYTQFVQVDTELWVANIVGQHRTIQLGEAVPIRYEALERGLGVVATFCAHKKATAHMPRLGAGLARGSWPRIEELVERTLVDSKIDVTVYDLARGPRSAV